MLPAYLWLSQYVNRETNKISHHSAFDTTFMVEKRSSLSNACSNRNTLFFASPTQPVDGPTDTFQLVGLDSGTIRISIRLLHPNTLKILTRQIASKLGYAGKPSPTSCS